MKTRPVLSHRRIRVVCALFAWMVAGATLAIPGAQAEDGPELFVSLRGAPGETVTPGEPLFVGVRLEAPFEATAPIELTPDWRAGVSIMLEPAGTGSVQPLTSQPMTPAQGGAVAILDAGRSEAGEWLVPSSATLGIEPGEYRLRVRWTRSTAAGAAFETTSDAWPVRFVALDSTAAEQVRQRTVALASEALFEERLAEAAAGVDALLAGQPDALRLLVMRARISARAGDLRGAMLCLTRAMNVPEVAQARHPPLELLELERQVGMAMLATDRPANVAVPEWVRLPESVRTLKPQPANR